MLSRRDLLALGAAGLSGAALARTGVFSPEATGPLLPGQAPKWRGRKPKNIIFLVADGMALQTVTMADNYSRAVLGKSSYWADLLSHPQVTNGFQITRSLSSVVTDSAAAASAWGSGCNIWNGDVNIYPDGTELRTLASLLQEAKMKVGLVTTTTMTHATPSGLSVHGPREDQAKLAVEHLTAGIEVLLGGGNQYFGKRKDKRDLYTEFKKAGYAVARTKPELMMAPAGKLLGIFDESHLPFTVDHKQSTQLMESVPTLAEMTAVAIGRLKGHADGFFLHVEGGKVDHAGHANDLAGMLHDQLAFEDAVRVAIEFAMGRGDTLVVVTTDHATGGPSLNGAGLEYADANTAVESWAGMKASYSPVFAAIGKTGEVSMVQDVVQSMLGYKLKLAEAELVSAAIKGNSPFAALELQKEKESVLALVLQNHTKVGWTSLNHTSDHVLVTAYGPGSQHFGGLNKNTDFFHWFLAARGIRFANPQISYAEGLGMKTRRKAASALRAHVHDDDCHC